MNERPSLWIPTLQNGKSRGETPAGIQVSSDQTVEELERGSGRGEEKGRSRRKGARPCLRVISRSPARRSKQKLPGVASARSQAGVRVFGGPRAWRGLGISRDGRRRWPPTATAEECPRSAVTRRASAASGGAGPGREASGNPGDTRQISSIAAARAGNSRIQGPRTAFPEPATAAVRGCGELRPPAVGDSQREPGPGGPDPLHGECRRGPRQAGTRRWRKEGPPWSHEREAVPGQPWASARPCHSFNGATIGKTFKGLLRDTVSGGVLGTFAVAWFGECLGSPRGCPFLVEGKTLFSAHCNIQRLREIERPV